MKFNYTVTVYNPAGAVASSAVIEMTEVQAAKVKDEARANGVRVELTKLSGGSALMNITAGNLLDVLSRSHSVITESEGADEHAELLTELNQMITLLRNEIGASHMGSGADEVLVERGGF